MPPSEDLPLVLIVDDDEVFRNRLCRALAQRNWEAEAVPDGEAALKFARDRSPDLVLVDLRMPGKGGLDAVQELRTIDSSMTIIVLTGYGSIPTAISAMKRGADHYLSKPADADQILVRLRESAIRGQCRHRKSRKPCRRWPGWNGSTCSASSPIATATSRKRPACWAFTGDRSSGNSASIRRLIDRAGATICRDDTAKEIASNIPEATHAPAKGEKLKSSLRNIVVLCALGAAGITSAQEAVNYASIGGLVTDPSGAVVDGAQVTARQIETNLTSGGTTDRDGRFRFPYLKVGQYEVTIHQQGFADVTRSLSLSVGSAFELPISLTVAAAASNVTVAGDAVVLEAARSEIASTVSTNEIKDLPLNGRNYFDIALLAPGVSPTNTAANQLFAETSAMPGQGISIGSQRNFSNSFIIDGVSANDDAAGVAGAFVGLDVVERVSGRHLHRPGGVGTRAWRLRQCGDQERRQHAARRRLRIFPQQPLQRGQRPFQYRSAAYAGAVRRQCCGTVRARQDLLFREFRKPRSEPVGTRHHLSRQRGGHQCAADERWISRPADLHRRLPNPGAHRKFFC